MNKKDDESPERPYVGAVAIQDQRLFFGRSTETEAVVDNLLAYRIVLLFSPSGAGKSSLIESGVKPKLIKDFNILPTIRLNRKPEPGKIPEGAAYNRFVLSALLSLHGEADAQAQAVLPNLIGTTLTAFLQQNIERDEHARRTLLVFDQFEELMTTDEAAKDEIAAFLEDLMAVLYDYRYWALFAMREDYLAELEPYLSYFPDRLSTHYYLKFLDKEAATEAIIGPADVCGVKFHSDAARKLVDELSIKRTPTAKGVIEQAGEFVEPVQLQVVCDDLWDRPRPDPKTITLDDVSNLAKIDTALADHYSRKVGSVAKELQIGERGIRDWFDQQLITDQGIRRQTLAGMEAEYGMSREAVMMLKNAYLVREDTRLGTTWYELAHDRLIRPVKEDNARWQNDNLSLLQVRATDWQHKGKLESLLLRGKDLIQAAAWEKGHPGELNEIDQLFLNASREWRKTHLSLLQRKAMEWDDRGRPDDFLSESDLEEAATWAADHTDEITSLDLEFLNASRMHLELEERERREQALQLEYEYKRTRTARFWALALGAATLVVILMLNFAIISRNNARQNANANATLAAENAAFGNAQATLASGNAAIAGTRAAVSDAQKTIVVDQISIIAANARIALTALAAEDIARAGKEKAEFNARQALARQLASQARSFLERRPDLGILLGLEAYRIEPLIWDTRSSLLAGLQYNLEQNVLPYELNIPTHLVETNNVTISPDSRTVAWSGSDGKIVLWDVAKKSVRELQDPNRVDITALAFSPRDPKLLVTGNMDDEMLFWNLQDGKAQRIETKGLTPDNRVVLHSNIRLLSISSDGTRLALHGESPFIAIWNVTSQTQVIAFETGARFYWDLEWSPDGRYLAAAGGDNSLYIFDPQSGNTIIKQENPDAAGRIYSLNWSVDGRRVAFAGSSGSGVARIYFYDMVSRKILKDTLDYSSINVHILSYNHPDGGLLVAAGYNAPVVLWRLKDNIQLPPLPEYSGYLNKLAFRGHLLAYLSNNTISVYELIVPDKLGRALPPNSQKLPFLIAAGQDGELRLFTPSTTGGSLEIRTNGESKFEKPGKEIPQSVTDYHVAFGPDDSLFLGNDSSGNVYLWNYSPPGLTRQVLSGLPTPITAMAASPDGNLLAASHCPSAEGEQAAEVCTPFIQLWDLTNQSAISEPITVTSGLVTSLAFSFDGSILASGSKDGTINLIDIKTRKPAGLPLGGFPVNIASLAFSPDGLILAAGTDQGTIFLWDVSGEQLLGNPFEVSQLPLVSLSFSPDSKTLYAGTQNGQLSAWDVDFDSWVRRACLMAGRSMTLAEWEQFLPNQDYNPACQESILVTPTP